MSPKPATPKVVGLAGSRFAKPQAPKSKMPPMASKEARQAQVNKSVENAREGLLDAEWEMVDEDPIEEGWEKIEKSEG